MGLSRLFLAVPVGATVKSMLSQHLSRRTLPGKVVPAENWHLTVRFLGAVDETRQEILIALLDQSELGEPFEVVLGDMGAFPRPNRANVLWLGLQRGEKELSHLNLICEEAVQTAGLSPEGRPFSAHLTLSRLRPHENVTALIGDYEPPPFRWRADELVLYETKPGPMYVVVETFPL